MREYVVKKLLDNKYAEIRDYDVHNCINRGIPMLVKYQDKQMLMSVDRLKIRDDEDSRLQKSKFGKDYVLYRYKFIPDL